MCLCVCVLKQIMDSTPFDALKMHCNVQEPGGIIDGILFTFIMLFRHRDTVHTVIEARCLPGYICNSMHSFCKRLQEIRRWGGGLSTISQRSSGSFLKCWAWLLAAP